MAPARLEVNFVRLLTRCEKITADKRGETEWRLEKYVGALEDMLRALKRSSRPTAEELKVYRRKVDRLKGLINTDKSSLKETGCQLPGPGRIHITANEKTPVSRRGRVQRKASLCQDGPPSESGSTGTDVRKRRALRLEDWRSGAELDALLQRQRRLAEDVLDLARELRENVSASRPLPPHHGQVLSPGAGPAVCEGKRGGAELPWLGLVLVSFISTILFITLLPGLW